MPGKKKQKVEIKSAKIKGKAVAGFVDGEPVAEIDRIKPVAKKTEASEVFVTSEKRKNIKVHTNKSDAIGRFGKRYPRLTPRFKKLI